MAKRFIDTGFLDQKWIRKLSPERKIFVIYLMLKCDNAGVIDLDMEDAEFWIGKKIPNPQTFLPEGFLILVKEDKYFIPKFLKWQYPNFPHSKVHQQKQAINILIGLDIFDNQTNSLSKSYLNLTQTLPNSQVIVNVNDNVDGNAKEKKAGKCLMRNSGTTQQMIHDSFKKTNDLQMANAQYYFNTASAWSDSKGEMRIDWIATVANFARRDLKDGKLQLQKKYRTQIEAAPDGFGEFNKKAVPMPDSLRKHISGIGNE